MRKKVLALFLTTAITASMLAGCGTAPAAAPAAGGSDAGAAETTQEETKKEETADAEPAETAEGEGTGLIAFDPASEGIENLKLIFHDLGYTEEDIVFARAE